MKNTIESKFGNSKEEKREYFLHVCEKLLNEYSDEIPDTTQSSSTGQTKKTKYSIDFFSALFMSLALVLEYELIDDEYAKNSILGFQTFVEQRKKEWANEAIKTVRRGDVVQAVDILSVVIPYLRAK